MRPLVVLLSVGLVVAVAGAVALLVPGDQGAVPIDGDGPTSAGPGTQGPAALDVAPSTRPATTSPEAVPSGGSGVPGTTGPHRWIVSGRVVDATTRAAVPGAALFIAPERSAENLGSTEGSELRGLHVAHTAADGTFRVALDPGPPTTLRIQPPDGLPTSLAIDGSRTDVVVELRAGLAITGRVGTRGGAALEDATVVYAPTGAGAGAGAATDRADVATAAVPRTDRGGRFRVVVDPKFPGSLTVTHPRHVRRTVRIDPGAARDLQIELTPALIAWVRLRASDGRSVERAQVLWTSGVRSGQDVLATGGPDVGRPAPASGGLGPLELPLDAGGTPISVRVMAPGYLPHADEWAAASPDGEDRTFDVTLVRDPGAATVSLRLERDDGAAIPFDADLPLTIERTDGGAVPGFSVTSDRREAATIDGLPAAPYRLRAWVPGSGPAVADVVAVAGTTVGAVARATPEARLTLRLTGTKGRRGLVRVLSGGKATFPQVLDDPSGTARVERVVVSGIASTVVLVGEEAVTLGGFGSGPHRVEVVSPDLAGPPVDVELKAGETARAEVVGTIR